MLMFSERDNVKVILADNNPFSIDVMMAKAIFYAPHVKPITLIEDYKERSMESCDFTVQNPYDLVN